MRNAVDNGDTGRVVQFYKGFLAEVGYQASAYQRAPSRPAATGKPVWTRDQVRQAYEQRRLGHISDARWPQIEKEIFAAANSGRIAGGLDKDGNVLTRL
jgi:hypothetical protein